MIDYIKATEHISKLIDQSGIRNNTLKEELLDHYLSAIEENVATGMSFRKALQQCSKLISTKDLSTIKRTHFFLNYKNHIMTGSSLIIVICTLLLTNITPRIDIQSTTQDPPSICPLSEITKNDITSGFGLRTSGFGLRTHPVTNHTKQHNGIDLKAKLGDIVVSPSNGTISETGYNNREGNYIVIKHDNIYQTKYTHLSKIKVIEKAQVLKGEEIGEVGTTGLSTAPHLHYEVFKSGIQVDPIDYLKV